MAVGSLRDPRHGKLNLPIFHHPSTLPLLAAHVSSVGSFPEIEGSQLTRWLGFASPILLPLVFLIAWLIVCSQAHL
jgi:hypothetical protein